jgi:hypothetical protein
MLLGCHLLRPCNPDGVILGNHAVLTLGERNRNRDRMIEPLGFRVTVSVPEMPRAQREHQLSNLKASNLAAATHAALKEVFQEPGCLKNCRPRSIFVIVEDLRQAP